MFRVAAPPADQEHVDRLGLLYFSRSVLSQARWGWLMPMLKFLRRPNNDVKLATVKESPVLQRLGFTQNEFEKNGHEVPSMEGLC